MRFNYINAVSIKIVLLLHKHIANLYFTKPVASARGLIDKQMQLFVKFVDCNNDSLELKKSGSADIILQIADSEHRIATYELKEKLLKEIYKSDLLASNNEKQDGDDKSSWLLILRGRVLADCDILDLYTLTCNDFLVFTEDNHAQSGLRPPMSQIAPSSTESDLLKVLLEMGFLEKNVRAILARCSDVNDAIALLTAENDGNGTNDAINAHIPDINHLINGYPELEPMKHLLCDIRYHHQLVEWCLQTRKMQISEAFTTMHHLFDDELLTQLMRIPMTTLAFLQLPMNAIHSISMQIDNRMNKDSVEVVNDRSSSARQRESVKDSSSMEALQRMIAMGFDPDLVLGIYESCNQNEDSTLESLLSL
uniref:AlNc14C225G9193 protein n=1 Tax=Albugo laibachii Nc14 TaxID=890382 RepID=F0WS54_9STRA|nr:AlNc14C225G9193 [Albugo laibachii Nc14]|eukprot:CCA24172.1 AlNc14C225G9193 [Albugo laibachii Nc14]